MASKLDIPLHGASLNIVRRCGPVLVDVLQIKFGCVAKIHGVDFERDPSFAQQRPTVQPEERFAVRLRAGVKVSVWKADLAHFQVDAVVNAANERLQHYGGLALALSEAGGPEIQDDCDKYIAQYGSLKIGQAIVTQSGRLPCNKIIHVVGPCLPLNPSQAEVSRAKPLLQMAVRNILVIAERDGLQSVAIPALSSGLFNFPLQRCAETIVAAVKDYYESKSAFHVPQEIRLANHDEPTVKAMEAACRQILPAPPQPSMYSQAVANPGRGEAKASPHKVQIGSVSLTLRKGKIEEQQADVIVNTAGPSRDLMFGELSKALSYKAGPKMQTELYDSRGTGNVVITKGYNLQCKEVYHTFCAENKQGTATTIISKAVSECLWLAASHKHKSIAIPAIGTGNLGFNKMEVAKIMADAVVEFAQNFPDTMDVHFIIFPRDIKTFEAFEHQMRSLHDRRSPPSTSHGSEPRNEAGSRAPTAQISLMSEHNEATREAERWFSGLSQSYGTVVIRNNFVQYFGERELQRLSREITKSVHIEEFFNSGCAGIMVKGKSTEDGAVVGVRVEAMLCDVQREFVKEEERAMRQVTARNVDEERKTVDHLSSLFSHKKSTFKTSQLRVVRVDKLENPALKKMFDLKTKQLHSSNPPRKMYQRIPAQFCDMVSHIGFHVEYAPPDDPAYGCGIYFTGSVNTALEIWRDLAEEEYLYFVEADVLTGNSTPGKPDLIAPPAVGQDRFLHYDSVSGKPDISVVFSGYQALPTYIIVCKKA